MLYEFSFKNVFSFKDTTTFSLEAVNSDKKLNSNYAIIDKYKILKSTAIFGPNASGKSNMIKALGSFLNSIRSSNFNLPNTKLFYVPFAFDKKTVNEPSEYELKFFIKGKKYTYFVKADADKIYEEKLYFVENKKEKSIFTRTNTNKYYFPEAEKEKLDKIKKFNADNKFFLSTATSWNYDKTKPVYEFLTDKIAVIMDFQQLMGYSFEEYSKNSNDLNSFTHDFLGKADFSISNFIVKKETEDFDITNIPIEIRNLVMHSPNMSQKITNYKAETLHKVSDEEYSLPFELESLGTQTILRMIPIIKDVLDNGKILFIDEMDNRLHTILTRYIVDLFHDNNIHNAQLVFNTHDTNILDLELLRRDQIWFTDKNRQNGTSELYALSEFEVRNNCKIEDAYLVGRYGAIPHII